ncbi:DegV family protein [Mycoplasma crocodyli]|uniref:Fatty acid-binding protein DegV-like protein n=1 Tax=Mycoplasma crocodyli (strain ATCC 51981 / MP145) TaxID=512564 RepID=D5E540_MYCCM|nr:DegV family protein [Mycoplasma crocodyli]ADE19430.1 fatty acid-binding protein DegV-like protein [Mycoplasma crocodyli MP145]
MKKLGIIIDSFSGITKQKADELNYGYLALQIELDGKIFEDGHQPFEEVLDTLGKSKKFMTSLPIYKKIENTISDFSKNYDEVIYISISSALSSTSVQAEAISKNFNNVHVIDNKFSGDQITDVASYVVKLFNETQDINQVIETVKNISSKSQTYIVPKNLDYIIKGGRLTGAKKFIMTRIPMIPILKFDGHVSVSGLKRSTKTAIAKVFEKLIKFAGGLNEIKNYSLRLICGNDNDIYQEVMDYTTSENIVLDSIQVTPSAVAVHCGPQAISLSIMPKLK